MNDELDSLLESIKNIYIFLMVSVPAIAVVSYIIYSRLLNG
jgi:hypothetical protein